MRPPPPPGQHKLNMIGVIDGGAVSGVQSRGPDCTRGTRPPAPCLQTFSFRLCLLPAKTPTSLFPSWFHCWNTLTLCVCCDEN